MTDGVGEGGIGTAGVVEATGGAGEGEEGLLILALPPLIAQPDMNVQQARNASQKVADRLDKRIVKNLRGFGPV